MSRRNDRNTVVIIFNENCERYYLIFVVSLLKTTIPQRHEAQTKRED